MVKANTQGNEIGTANRNMECTENVTSRENERDT
jgi:hypothetical protein